ncbi:DNA ligase [Favolaschia claudopus]|uniref:DNA ligase n=1 Tax=Favolaschia claudopus TaxID=2862362 RepID=A0AAW0BY58_9AGAR
MSTTSHTPPQGVPFSFFVSLLREISLHNRPKKAGAKGPYPALATLNNWISTLRTHFAPLPANTTATVFRLLFPDQDTRRKYDMQETRLASAVADCFGKSATSLSRWSADGSSGCLGEEVYQVLNKSCSYSENYNSPLSIADVDNLLEELASFSKFSDISVRNKEPSTNRRSRSIVIRELYRSMSPLDASFLTQIILKDLRPLLYPVPDPHYTVTLKSFNSRSVTQLSKEDAMHAWDATGQMLKIYRVRSGLDDAAAAFDAGFTTDLVPQIGTPVEIPKSEKGRGCLHALDLLRHSNEVWAETKYDGERAQIHVQILENGKSRITIFSKSKRDSTWDRYGIHEVIRETLGLHELEGRSSSSSKVKSDVILDAEMVAWHGDKIDEFWRIRALVEQTARGARNRAQHDVSLVNYSQASLMTDVSDDRRLGLVFFDILMLDSASLVSVPYSSRRSILESIVRPIPGRVILANRTRVAANNHSTTHPSLYRIFAQCLAAPEEGLVLKAGEAGYNARRFPWVKLKRDYIPKYGDCLDLVILGCSWDKNRARELQVSPNAYTTFYIGGLHNADQLKKDPSTRPHFHIYFTASYGLSRDALEETNFLVKSSDPIPYSAQSEFSSSLPFTFAISSGLASPAIILREPLLAELFGAGFTKSPRSTHYELRFPRINKVYRPGERTWREGINLQALHQVAREVVGRDRSDKDIDDWGSALFGRPVSPGVSCLTKRKAREDSWEQDLIAYDQPRVKKRCGAVLPKTLSSYKLSVTKGGSNSGGPQLLSSSPAHHQEPGGPPASHTRKLPMLPSTSHNSTLTSKILADELQQLPAETETISHVLSKSLVFIATQIPTARQSWMAKVPSENVVHSLEGLFVACGWVSGRASIPVVQPEQGVIVLDVEDAPALKVSILNVLKARKASCVDEPRRKAICLLERKLDIQHV